MSEERDERNQAAVGGNGVAVGQILKQRRQAMRLSLAQVEKDTKVRGRFLTALEAGDYSSMPNDIYSRGFVQHYANYLGLDGREVAAAYASERGGVEEGETKRERFVRPKRLIFTGPIIIAVSVTVAIALVLMYVLWQFSALAAPPVLTVSSPANDAVISSDDAVVSGRVTPGSDLSINDSAVYSDTNGNFREKVALQNGVNSVKITARSKLGKTTSVTRNVLARLTDAAPLIASVPAVTFDGVAVVLSVTETTAVVVKVDGAEKFRGTFLAGKSRVFTGTRDVRITTGNAGATSLSVTNLVAAGRRISPLGKSGELKQDLVFAKDTVIP